MVGYLEANPENLLIERKGGGSSGATVFTLSNPTAIDAIFKIKFTAPTRADVKPSCGFVAGLDQVEVVVTPTAAAFQGPDFRSHEKLLVAAAKAPVARGQWHSVKARAVWKTDVVKSEVFETKLAIKFKKDDVSSPLPEAVKKISPAAAAAEPEFTEVSKPPLLGEKPAISSPPDHHGELDAYAGRRLNGGDVGVGGKTDRTKPASAAAVAAAVDVRRPPSPTHSHEIISSSSDSDLQERPVFSNNRNVVSSPLRSNNRLNSNPSMNRPNSNNMFNINPSMNRPNSNNMVNINPSMNRPNSNNMVNNNKLGNNGERRRSWELSRMDHLGRSNNQLQTQSKVPITRQPNGPPPPHGPPAIGPVRSKRQISDSSSGEAAKMNEEAKEEQAPKKPDEQADVAKLQREMFELRQEIRDTDASLMMLKEGQKDLTNEVRESKSFGQSLDAKYERDREKLTSKLDGKLRDAEYSILKKAEQSCGLQSKAEVREVSGWIKESQARLEEKVRDMSGRLQLMEDRLAAGYASKTHLKDMETRLKGNLDDARNDLERQIEAAKVAQDKVAASSQSKPDNTMVLLAFSSIGLAIAGVSFVIASSVVKK